MIGPLGVGYLMWAGLATLIAGLALLALRPIAKHVDVDADLARALIVTAIALMLSDVALARDMSWLWWLSGFAVCAAAHRWVDAFTPNSPSPAAPHAADLSQPKPKPKKPKA
jgi:hypothetical protein